ncbi:hypothetical protein ABE096_05270 [Robertmurraya massiliosenegalensis]|uniref:hypothetical protein n=1 Tax=Robertmurraya TaxID=2837507 RepID=UPI0039A5F1DA
MAKKDNPIAKALFIVGIFIIAASAITGLIYGTSLDYYFLGELQSTLGWSVFISGIISGLFFLGFSEIIKLLQGIYNQNEKQSADENYEVNLDKSPEIKPIKSTITDQVIQEITEFYQVKNVQVENIEETDKEDFFKVTLEDGSTEQIELGGFKPIVHSEKDK